MGRLSEHASHNEDLLAQVHPSDWPTPKPRSMYDLVVIGGGTAGLVSAAGAAGLGARVALIERDLLGGDCLNFGCVPSKALLHCARLGPRKNRSAGAVFAEAMDYARRSRATVSPHDSAKKLRSLGVHVFFGEARFQGQGRVFVDGKTLRFRKAVIATGSSPVVPDIPGLGESDPLTNETLFDLDSSPGSLAVLGGGPVGCEMSQALQRLGVEVTLVQRNSRLLPRDLPEAANSVEKSLREDGVSVRLDTQLRRVKAMGAGLELELESSDGTAQSLFVKRILVASGRRHHLESLGLESVGVAYDEKTGIHVDDRLRSTNHRIFACGDVASGFKFTHMADAMARIVVQNAFLPWPRKASSLVVPWVTFTAPEVARVGLNSLQARNQGRQVRVLRAEFQNLDRAIVEEEAGFVELVLAARGDRILGATVVHPLAGELISTITLAMTQGVGLGRFSYLVQPYPTRGEIFRKLADEYTRSRLTPSILRWLRPWVRWY